MKIRKSLGIALGILALCLSAHAAPQGDPAARTKPKPKAARPKRPAARRGAFFSTRPAFETVNITNFNFTPKVLTIRVGGTVIWQNKEGSHTVTADNGSFSSPTLTAGQSFNHQFTKKGTYRYYCSFHGGAGGRSMSGTVRVVP